jgi:hypothetical protein
MTPIYEPPRDGELAFPWSVRQTLTMVGSLLLVALVFRFTTVLRSQQRRRHEQLARDAVEDD